MESAVYLSVDTGKSSYCVLAVDAAGKPIHQIGVPNAEQLVDWAKEHQATRGSRSAGWCGRVVAEVVLAISHTGAPRQNAPNAGKLRRGDTGRVRTACIAILAG
jgi:hypothetical protein